MALINKVNFTRFTRWGVNLGRLTYTAATHEEATDGTDELKITCDEDLTKGERLVWVDRQGKVHEHVVDEIERLHDDSGKPYTSVTCINSINETWDDYIEDKRPSGSVAVALASILAGTRWEVGNCDQPGSASHTFYHISVREGLSDLLETWGGELETVIETDGVRVTHRYVRVVATRGNQQSPKRFTWTKDLISIKRKTGSANPKTRVYGYGKGVETDTGGYGRRLTFGDINGGKDYVEDASATEVWGHPDGSGGIAPAVDVYVNEQCEDAAQLLAETRDYLETVKTPTVSYEASVLDLFAFGRSWEGVAVGDCVAIIDKGFSDTGIRLKGRVSKLSRDLVTGDATVTFGNLTDALTDMWQKVAGALRSGAASRANYDAVANPSVGWLTLLQSALNKQFNAVGTYKVESFELGQIFSNVALNPETGTPVKTTSNMWAVNINGMGIRLASSLTANGQWNWTTFITGASVNADCINAGTMHADRVRAGLLTDEKGKNFWNLDTGEFSLSPTATIGGKDLATTDAAVESVDVEYAQSDSNTQAPASGWKTTAPTWASGKYIWQRTKTVMQSGSVSYSQAVCISGRNGIDGAPGAAGADGKDGTPGKDGKDASPIYFHRAYATSADGKQGFSTTYVAGCKYLGTYVDNVLADSTDPSKYDWALFVGKDGSDGTPGKNGVDGTTYYLHIAYATSADGKQGFSVDDTTDKTYIGQLVDTNKQDSTTPESYSWSLIKGSDGIDGIGVSSIVEQYYLSTSNMSVTGGSWSDKEPTWKTGCYYWTRSCVTWSDASVTYTDPILAQGINAANEKAFGAADSVSSLDDSLDQEGVFRRLTNNGAEQGLYLKDGKLYLNSEYIESGIFSIKDKHGIIVAQLDSETGTGLRVLNPYTSNLESLSWTAFRPSKIVLIEDYVFECSYSITPSSHPVDDVNNTHVIIKKVDFTASTIVGEQRFVKVDVYGRIKSSASSYKTDGCSGYSSMSVALSTRFYSPYTGSTSGNRDLLFFSDDGLASSISTSSFPGNDKSSRSGLLWSSIADIGTRFSAQPGESFEITAMEFQASFIYNFNGKNGASDRASGDLSIWIDSIVITPY